MCMEVYKCDIMHLSNNLKSREDETPLKLDSILRHSQKPPELSSTPKCNKSYQDLFHEKVPLFLLASQCQSQANKCQLHHEYWTGQKFPYGFPQCPEKSWTFPHDSIFKHVQQSITNQSSGACLILLQLTACILTLRA